ncbi:hypothetical protein GGI12_002675 [Dipsacomyces acuminosporus]|nr:hypothetical protein GGI12_002675 [Dipsacomyces acuminosporus]
MVPAIDPQHVPHPFAHVPQPLPPASSSMAEAAAAALSPARQYGTEISATNNANISDSTAVSAFSERATPQYIPPGSIRPSPPPLYPYGYGGPVQQPQQQYLPFPPQHHQLASSHLPPPPPPYVPMYIGAANNASGGYPPPGTGDVPYFYGPMQPQLPQQLPPSHAMMYTGSMPTDGQAIPMQEHQEQFGYQPAELAIATGPNEQPSVSYAPLYGEDHAVPVSEMPDTADNSAAIPENGFGKSKAAPHQKKQHLQQSTYLNKSQDSSGRGPGRDGKHRGGHRDRDRKSHRPGDSNKAEAAAKHPVSEEKHGSKPKRGGRGGYRGDKGAKRGAS